MTSPQPLNMPLFQKLARLTLPCLLLASSVMGTPAHASLTTDTSTYTDGSTPAFIYLTADEQSKIQTQYTSVNSQITTTKSKAVDLRIRLNAGDTTVTETDYNTAITEVTSLQNLSSALYSYIHENDNTTTSSDDTSSSSSSGSSSLLSGIAGGIASSMAQQVTSQLLGTTNNFGGLATGNTGTSLLGSTTTGTTGTTTATRTNNKTAEQIIAEKNAAAAKKKKEEEERAAACAAATTDTSPGKATDDNASAYTVSGKEADDDTTSGGSVAAASANAKAKAEAAAKAKAEARKKYNCDKTDTGTQVTTPNPVGKGGVSMEQALALQASNECQWSSANTEERNKCECASLAKKLAGLDRASTWKTGAQATSDMAPGAIATMDAGGYCDSANRGGRPGCHAAYYLGNNMVIEQYNRSGGPIVSYWPDSKLAKYNRVISGQQTSMFHPFNEAPLWMVLNLKPYTMGLLKS